MWPSNGPSSFSYDSITPTLDNSAQTYINVDRHGASPFNAESPPLICFFVENVNVFKQFDVSRRKSVSSGIYGIRLMKRCVRAAVSSATIWRFLWKSQIEMQFQAQLWTNLSRAQNMIPWCAYVPQDGANSGLYKMESIAYLHLIASKNNYEHKNQFVFTFQQIELLHCRLNTSTTNWWRQDLHTLEPTSKVDRELKSK